jgi:membrane-associated PAP2 superfamily phosphatase
MHRSRPFVWLSGLLAITLLWDASGLDRAVMQAIGSPQGFALRDAWWLSAVLHDGLRTAMTLAWLLLVVWALWPGLRLPRRERWWVVALVSVSLLAVNLVKNASLTSCPWDLRAFGGSARHVSHWAWGVVDGGPGRCFPGGHASSGFAFLALALPWLLPPAGAAPRRHVVGLRWLAAAVFIGLLAGAVQTVRGAHFPSHTLWTLVICAALSVTGWWLASPTQQQPQRQVHRHATNDGAQHAALPEKPGRAGSSGVQARVLPGGDERALAHHDLGHDHGSQRRDGRVLQTPLRPVRQAPGLAGDEEKTACDHGDAAQQHDGEQRPGVHIKHGALPAQAHPA